jgi:hypothetical protein
MDDVRRLLISTAASLTRLQLRLFRQIKSSRRLDNGNVELGPRWCVAELDPPSQWLQSCPGGMSLDGVLQRVLEAQMYLMASITGPDPIDLRAVCRSLHHMSGDPVAWSVPVLRLSERLNIKLKDSPMLEFNAAGLCSLPLPGSEFNPIVR